MTVLGDPAKARVAATAMLMLPGMPFVYYGEEIGMVGPKPDELIRTPMQWSSAANGGFTTGAPSEPLQADWQTKNVAIQDHDPTSLLNHYRTLIHLRNANAALNVGSLSVLRTDDTTGTIAAWLRSSNDTSFLVVLNFGGRHGPLYMPKLPLRATSRGLYWFESSSYADPAHACTGAFISANNEAQVNSIAAQSSCVLRIGVSWRSPPS